MRSDDGVVSAWMQDFVKFTEQLGEFKDLDATAALQMREKFRNTVAQVAEAL